MRWWCLAVALMCAAIALGAGAPFAAGAAAGNCTSEAKGKALVRGNPGVGESILPLETLPSDVVSVPTWSGSFTSNGTTYPYTMVGTDPAAGSVTTHVSVEIVPLSLDFAGNGCILGSPGMAADIESSPLFTPSFLRTGITQYVDDVQRGSFWSEVSTVSPAYHLLLDPTDIPAVTLHVPASEGLTLFNPFTNRTEGVVSLKWLDVQIVNLINSLHISPTTYALFVPYNTFVALQNPNDCLTPAGCATIIGYHRALLSNKNPHAVNTYAVASFLDYGTALPPQFDISSEVASHETVEWANDPFDHHALVAGRPFFFSNTAPAWTSPYFGFCTSTLEVADPLEGSQSPLLGVQTINSSTIYLLANAAFLSWFSRESPSSAIGGLYDEGGVFSTYSPTC